MQSTLKNSLDDTFTTKYVVYMLLCANGSYYTGYTSNLMRRYQQHLAGTARCKYTRSFKPLQIAQQWKIPGDKATAMKIEAYIKKLSKAEKERLVQLPERLFEQLNQNRI